MKRPFFRRSAVPSGEDFMIRKLNTFLVFICMILFAGCGSTPEPSGIDFIIPDSMNHATPSAIDNSMVLLPENEDLSTVEFPTHPLPWQYTNYVRLEAKPEKTFIDKNSVLTFSDEEACKFFGIQVNGSREGTILEGEFVSINEEKTIATVKIKLTFADGSSIDATLDIDYYFVFSKWCDLQCIDIDGDGTDEIFARFNIRSTASEGDLHILKVTDTELKEIGTALFISENDTIINKYEETKLHELEACAGIEPIETADGILLRIYDSFHLYDVRFVEYKYRNEEWHLIQPIISTPEHFSVWEALKRWELLEAYGFSDEEPIYNLANYGEESLYWDRGLDTYGSGIKEERLYGSEFYFASEDRDISIIEYERIYGLGERILLGCFDGSIWEDYCFIRPCDIDGDGADEIVLALFNPQNEKRETYIFKQQNDTFHQVFYHSTAGEDGSYQIPLQIELPSFMNAVDWNKAVTRVWLEEFPEGISLMMVHGTEWYSRIGWSGNEWALLEQGKIAVID